MFSLKNGVSSLLNLSMQRVTLSIGFIGNRYLVSNDIGTSAFCNAQNLNRTEIKKIQEKFWEKEKENYENTFGNIDSFEKKFSLIKDDPDDIKQYEQLKSAQGKTFVQYHNEITQLLKEKRYKTALHILEVDMVNDNIKRPTSIYGMLINYNAKIGCLKEAYRLYLAFKKRQGVVSGAMYTSMFNACAECTNSMLALEKVEVIREHLRNDKNHNINCSNYNALIKAYGRHGDLTSAFKVLDEILERRDKISGDTYSFLFQSCISDKNSGLRHALILWRKMLQIGVKPSIYHFNLLLRCVRECSFGDIRLLEDFVKLIKSESQHFFKRKVIFKNIDGVKKRKVIKILRENPFKSLLNAERKHSVNDPKEEENVENVKNENLIASEGLTKESGEPFSTFESNTHFNNSCNNLTFCSEKLREEILEKFKVRDVNEVKNSSAVPVQNKVKELVENNFSSQSENLKVMSEGSESNNTQSLTVCNYSLQKPEFPNFLDLQPSIGDACNFGSLNTPHQRFMCLGGLNGFLKTMSLFKINPDVKTLTLLLDVVPPTEEAEKEVLSLARKHKVKLDTTFFNVLIKRRVDRNEVFMLQETLKLMQEEDITPDIITFGSLALSCNELQSATELINCLHEFGMRLNNEILQILLYKACFADDMTYLKMLLQVAKEDDLCLTPKNIATVEKIIMKKKNKAKSN